MRKTNFQHLPYELHVQILSRLTFSDLYNLHLSSRFIGCLIEKYLTDLISLSPTSPVEIKVDLMMTTCHFDPRLPALTFYARNNQFVVTIVELFLKSPIESDECGKTFQTIISIFEICQALQILSLSTGQAGDERKVVAVQEVAMRGMVQDSVLLFLKNFGHFLGVLRGGSKAYGSVYAIDVSRLLDGFTVAQKGIMKIGVSDTKLLKTIKQLQGDVLSSLPNARLVPSVCECGTAFKSIVSCEGCDSNYCDIVRCSVCQRAWCGDCQMVVVCKICSRPVCLVCRERKDLAVSDKHCGVNSIFACPCELI